MENETLVNFGGEIKAIDSDKIGGYLVLFSDAKSPDLKGDFFTKDTDFGIVDGDKTAIYFNHRMPLKTKDKKYIAVREKIGEGTLKTDDKGVLVEAILYNRKEYEEGLAAMGWSSGTAAHLTDREQKGDAYWIKTWPLKLDASMTPRPCEPKTAVISLKSYIEEEQEPKVKTEEKSIKTESETPVVDATIIKKSMKVVFAERLAGYKEESKGMIADELAETQTGYYELGCALREVAKDIANAAASSDITGVTVDVSAKVTEMVMEYAALLIPNIVKQINDFADKDIDGDYGSSYFYLKSHQTGTVFNSLIDKDGNPRTGLRMQEHSETVLTAARELGANATATLKAAEALAQRFDGKQELDVKAGRVFSATNRERIKKHHGEVIAAADQLHAVAGGLMDLYEKTDPVPKEKPKSVEPDELLNLAAQWTQQRILHVDTV